MDRIAPALGGGTASEGSIHLVSALVHLDLSFCSALTHLDFLEGCSKLRRINLASCANLTDVNGLAHCGQLTHVGMWGAAKVSSIGAIASGCPLLTMLDCTAMPSLRERSALTAVQSCVQLTQAHFDEQIAKFIEENLHIEATSAEPAMDAANMSMRAGALSPVRKRGGGGHAAKKGGGGQGGSERPRRGRRGSVDCFCGVRGPDSPCAGAAAAAAAAVAAAAAAAAVAVPPPAAPSGNTRNLQSWPH